MSQLRALGRKTRGVLAMKLKEGDKMASMDIIPATSHNMPETYSRLYHPDIGVVIRT